MALPTIVTIHGLGLDAASFAPMLARVATPFAAHGIDLPGFGPRRDAPWTSVDAIAHDVAREIVHAVGADPWMLVGHSMGGIDADAARAFVAAARRAAARGHCEARQRRATTATVDGGRCDCDAGREDDAAVPIISTATSGPMVR